ncbi:MAG: class I SAM-dependent methyltransferase [Chromatiales bacterium]|nr:class I SAM-dependent methyltransferase [Chromatiales bacterium]
MVTPDLPNTQARELFARGGTRYARHRPGYPPELFDRLVALAPTRSTALDCAAGTGQATLPLAEYFERVIAIDTSADQLRALPTHPRCHRLRAAAEQLPLANASVSLVCVAQALHWFEHERFFAETQRILIPGGVFAAWTYALARVNDAVDAVVDHLYREVLEPDWPPQRRHVETGYAQLPFPFAPIAFDPMAIELDWRLGDLVAYLGTWSAVARHRERTGHDPLALIDVDLRSAWGEPSESKRIRWPLALRVGRR